MKILVTGGTGFVGQHVVDLLLGRGCDVRLLVRPTSRLPSRWSDRLEFFVGDFGDQSPLGAAVADCDTVINIAHSMGGSRGEIERAAIGGTCRLFAEARGRGVKRLVHVSSIGVLPMGASHRGRAMPEEPVYETEPQYMNDYVFGKIATEQAALALGKLGGVSVAVLRPGIVFGPGGSWRVSRLGTVIGRRILLLGGGRQPLPFVYVENLADALVRAALDAPEAEGIFHLIDDYALSAGEFAQALKSRVDPALSLIRVPRLVCRLAAWPIGTLARSLKRTSPLHAGQVDGCSIGYRYSTERSNSVLGWHPQVGKEEALRRSMEFWAVKARLPRGADLRALGVYGGSGGPVRVAIVGCGGIAAEHAKFLRGLSHARLVACCDAAGGRAAEFAGRHGIVASYDSLDRMLAAGGLDAVHILTPPTATHAVASRCLAEGLHVLVEKPMAMSATEGRDLYACAKKAGRMLCVDHNHAMDRVMVEARRWICSGALGEVIWMDSYYGFDLRGNPGNPLLGPDAASNWNYRLPGGLFQNLLPHPLSVVVEFLPDALEVDAHARSFNFLAHQPSDELRLFLTSARAGASVTVSLASSPRFQTLMVYCTNGAMQLDFVYKLVRVYRSVPGIPRALQRLAGNLRWGGRVIGRNLEIAWKHSRGTWVHYDGMGRLIAEFHASVLAGTKAPIGEPEALRTLSIMDETWRQVGRQDIGAVPRGLLSRSKRPAAVGAGL
jgi:predicted dehydrogenase/nucleoside-diphosphate-sugar epimerase